jgi:hypothetical protein
MSNERTDRAVSNRLPEILFPLLVVLLFADPLFTGRSFAGRDLVPYNLPVEREIHDAWAHGSLPLWSAHFSGGRPLLANPNVGAFFPPRLLLALLPFETAFRIYPVLLWIAAGLGMIALARALGAGSAAAWLGAVTFVFSGVGMAEVFYTNHQPGMALLPWVLWAAARPVGRVAHRVLPLAGFLALDVYAGEVFTVVMGIGACALWVLLEVDRKRRLAEAYALAGSLALGALLAAPQILASTLWAPWTTRAVAGLPLGVATSLSISPWRLLELVVPYPFGGSWSLDTREFWGRAALRDFFPSLFCGGLAVLGLAATAGRQGPGFRFVRWYAAAAVLVSVGPSLLPAAWGAWRSPIPLRYPEKFAVALVFALALAVALGLARAEERWSSWRRILVALGAGLAGLAVAARMWPGIAGSAAAGALAVRVASPHDVGRQVASALAEGGLLWVATLVGLDLRAGRSRRLSAAALALFTAVPVVATRRIAPTFAKENVFAPTPFARFAAKRDPAMRFRELDASSYRPPDPHASEQRYPAGVESFRQSFFYYTATLWNRGTVLNSDPDVGDLSRTESLRRLSERFPSVPNANAIFSSLSLAHEIRHVGEEPLPGFRFAGGNAFQAWDVNPAALPCVRVAAAWRGARDAVEALAAFPALEAGEVVVESGTREGGRDPGAQLADVDDTPNALAFSVSSPAPVWVFVLRGYWPYRDVRVDGSPVEVVPAQLAFSAVPVPAGSHRVEWKERMPGGSISWAGPVAALVAALALLRRRQPRPGAEAA